MASLLGEQLRPVPAAVDEVIARAGADDPADRFDTAEGFLEALSAALGRPAAPEEVAEAALTAARNPYKGLQAFQESDAADFYGRADVVDELLAAVSSHRLVAVVARRGSASRLWCGPGWSRRCGAVRSGGTGWSPISTREFPFDELAAALLRVAACAAPVWSTTSPPTSGAAALRPGGPPAGSRLLLVIDQFEELFTLTLEEDTRRRFLDNLVTLSRDERSPVTVVVTLRADFLDRPLRYPEFGDLLGASTVMVAAPGPDESGRGDHPTGGERGGRFGAGLAERIAGDVADQPGASLLQYSLTELFERRGSDRLSEADYLRSGGWWGRWGGGPTTSTRGVDHAGQEARPPGVPPAGHRRRDRPGHPAAGGPP